MVKGGTSLPSPLFTPMILSALLGLAGWYPIKALNGLYDRIAPQDGSINGIVSPTSSSMPQLWHRAEQPVLDGLVFAATLPDRFEEWHAQMGTRRETFEKILSVSYPHGLLWVPLSCVAALPVGRQPVSYGRLSASVSRRISATTCAIGALASMIIPFSGMSSFVRCNRKMCSRSVCFPPHSCSDR